MHLLEIKTISHPPPPQKVEEVQKKTVTATQTLGEVSEKVKALPLQGTLLSPNAQHQTCLTAFLIKDSVFGKQGALSFCHIFTRLLSGERCTPGIFCLNIPRY